LTSGKKGVKQFIDDDNVKLRDTGLQITKGEIELMNRTSDSKLPPVGKTSVTFQTQAQDPYATGGGAFSSPSKSAMKNSKRSPSNKDMPEGLINSIESQSARG